jgi:hypothetical protein
MSTAPEALIERIAQRLPDVRPLLAEFQAEQLGEMWEAVFLDEATRQLVARAVEGDQAAVADLTTLAGILEAEHGEGADVENLISGFLSPFPYPGEPGHDLVQLLGPKLAADLNRQREWRTRPQETAFVDRMVQAIPALAPLVDENRAGSRGDVLPHRFLADVAFQAVEHHLSGKQTAHSEVRAVIDLLEAEFGRDDGVDNAIAVSFVENLPYDGEPGADIVRLLGPKLKEELHRQRLSPSPDAG